MTVEPDIVIVVPAGISEYETYIPFTIPAVLPVIVAVVEPDVVVIVVCKNALAENVCTSLFRYGAGTRYAIY